MESSSLIITNPGVEPLEPDSTSLHQKMNGHLRYSQASLRSSHYGAFGYCSKFYCCCYVPSDEDNVSVSTSSSGSSVSSLSQSVNIVENAGATENEASNDSRRESVSTMTITQVEDESLRQENDAIPPNCFPTRLLDRYACFLYSITFNLIDFFIVILLSRESDGGAKHRTNPDTLKSCLCFRVFRLSFAN